MNWPPYPEYKNSGIEWLGDVPSSWGVAEIKLTHQVTLGKMLQTEASGSGDVLLPYLRAAHIPPTGFTLNDPKEMWFTLKEKSELTLKKGDVVVVEGGMGGYGRCDIVPEDVPGWGFQNSINRLRPKNGNNGAFTKYLLQIARENGYIDVLCSVSTMPHLTAEKLGAIRLPLPTVDEQSKIADFLDFETAKTDALMGKQEQLIATLREDRTATITCAVTKGLEAEVQMEGTSAAWLPQIPANWKIRPVKSYGKLITGKTPPSENEANFSEEGFPWIRPQDIDNHTGITVPSAGISQSGLQYINRIPDDSVLVCCIGAGSIGKVGYSHHAACTNQQITAIADAPSPRYLFYLMLAAEDQILSFAAINRLPIINNERLGSIQVPFPPIGEMTKIANYLDAQCDKIDKLIAKAAAVIATLREFRSALITDAVTGKIDVRAAA